METFELLPSLAQGELAETSAPELVAAVFRSRASGTLWMEVDDSEIRCFFRAGDMCGTGAFKGFQTLAHVLLVNDWVAALDIESTREEAAGKGLRHGEVLVEKGMLTHDQLRTALGAQHTANLTTLLSLTHGKYDWRGWEPPPPWAREVVVDPVICLVDALELEQHASRRHKILDWLGSNAARLSMDWPELQGRVTLGALERRAAALLALPRGLAEFVQASRMPQPRAEALLVALLLAGGVEPQPQSAAPPARAKPRAPEPEPILEPLPEHEVHQELLDEPEPELRPEPDLMHPEPELQGEPELIAEPEPELFPDPGLRHEPAPDPFAEPRLQAPQPRRAAVDEENALARLDSFSLDEMTPAPDGAAREAAEEPLEIDHRPYRGAVAPGGRTAGVAREEPTFEHALELENVPAEDERSRDLRKKLMARGLRNLGGTPAGRPEQGAVMEAPHERAPVDETKLTREDQSFVDEVRSRARLAPGQSAYARLGVSPAAPTDQIKTAYLTLAKRFHPDRASGPGMSPMQPELQSLFALLKEGYDFIASPAQRAKYDAQLKAGGGLRPGSRKDEAVLSLKMGDVLLKKRDFEGAINKLRRSVDLDATGDALAALAWALVADPKGSPASKEEAATLINRALRAPGTTARTYYVAGVLWRTKDPDSAVDAFRKAMELDPQHSDAALELRLIEQRRGNKSKTGGGVLSGLLFGKRKS